jgi:hypothetical protein
LFKFYFMEEYPKKKRYVIKREIGLKWVNKFSPIMNHLKKFEFDFPREQFLIIFTYWITKFHSLWNHRINTKKRYEIGNHHYEKYENLCLE